MIDFTLRVLRNVSPTVSYLGSMPLVLLVGAVVAIAKYVSLGTANLQLYIIAGIGTSLFIFFSKILFRIPPDSRRIE